jgi:hypothetical protein
MFWDAALLCSAFAQFIICCCFSFLFVYKPFLSLLTIPPFQRYMDDHNAEDYLLTGFHGKNQNPFLDDEKKDRKKHLLYSTVKERHKSNLLHPAVPIGIAIVSYVVRSAHNCVYVQCILSVYYYHVSMWSLQKPNK